MSCQNGVVVLISNLRQNCSSSKQNANPEISTNFSDNKRKLRPDSGLKKNQKLVKSCKNYSDKTVIKIETFDLVYENFLLLPYFRFLGLN